MKNYYDFINEDSNIEKRYVKIIDIGISNPKKKKDKEEEKKIITINGKEYENTNSFTLRGLSVKWGDLDQVLIEANKKIKDKIIDFHGIEGKKIRIRAKQMLYVRYVSADGKLGNQWYVVDDKGNKHQVAVNLLITPYKAIIKIDPYGEEDWETDE
jgi:hypothetical protein